MRRVVFPKAVGGALLIALAASAVASAATIATVGEGDFDEYTRTFQVLLGGTALGLFTATALGCVVDRSWAWGALLAGATLSVIGLAISVRQIIGYRSADADLFKALGVTIAASLTVVALCRLSLSIGSPPPVTTAAGVTALLTVGLGVKAVVDILSERFPVLGDESELGYALLVLTVAGFAVTALLNRTVHDHDGRRRLPRTAGLGLAVAVGGGAVLSAILLATLGDSESSEAIQEVAGKVVLTHLALMVLTVTALACFVDRPWGTSLGLSGAVLSALALATSLVGIWSDSPGDGVARSVGVLLALSIALALAARLSLRFTGHPVVAGLAALTAVGVGVFALLLVSQIFADEAGDGVFRAMAVIAVLTAWGALSAAILDRTFAAGATSADD